MNGTHTAAPTRTAAVPDGIDAPDDATLKDAIQYAMGVAIADADILRRFTSPPQSPTPAAAEVHGEQEGGMRIDVAVRGEGDRHPHERDEFTADTPLNLLPVDSSTWFELKPTPVAPMCVGQDAVPSPVRDHLAPASPAGAQHVARAPTESTFASPNASPRRYKKKMEKGEAFHIAAHELDCDSSDDSLDPYAEQGTGSGGEHQLEAFLERDRRLDSCNDPDYGRRYSSTENEASPRELGRGGSRVNAEGEHAPPKAAPMEDPRVCSALTSSEEAAAAHPPPSSPPADHDALGKSGTSSPPPPETFDGAPSPSPSQQNSDSRDPHTPVSAVGAADGMSPAVCATAQRAPDTPPEARSPPAFTALDAESYASDSESESIVEEVLVDVEEAALAAAEPSPTVPTPPPAGSSSGGDHVGSPARDGVGGGHGDPAGVGEAPAAAPAAVIVSRIREDGSPERAGGGGSAKDGVDATSGIGGAAEEKEAPPTSASASPNGGDSAPHESPRFMPRGRRGRVAEDVAAATAPGGGDATRSASVQGASGRHNSPPCLPRGGSGRSGARSFRESLRSVRSRSGLGSEYDEVICGVPLWQLEEIMNHDIMRVSETEGSSYRSPRHADQGSGRWETLEDVVRRDQAATLSPPLQPLPPAQPQTEAVSNTATGGRGVADKNNNTAQQRAPRSAGDKSGEAMSLSTLDPSTLVSSATCKSDERFDLWQTRQPQPHPTPGTADPRGGTGAAVSAGAATTGGGAHAHEPSNAHDADVDEEEAMEWTVHPNPDGGHGAVAGNQRPLLAMSQFHAQHGGGGGGGASSAAGSSSGAESPRPAVQKRASGQGEAEGDAAPAAPASGTNAQRPPRSTFPQDAGGGASGGNAGGGGAPPGTAAASRVGAGGGSHCTASMWDVSPMSPSLPDFRPSPPWHSQITPDTTAGDERRASRESRGLAAGAVPPPQMRPANPANGPAAAPAPGGTNSIRRPRAASASVVGTPHQAATPEATPTSDEPFDEASLPPAPIHSPDRSRQPSGWSRPSARESCATSLHPASTMSHLQRTGSGLPSQATSLARTLSLSGGHARSQLSGSGSLGLPPPSPSQPGLTASWQGSRRHASLKLSASARGRGGDAAGSDCSPLPSPAPPLPHTDGPPDAAASPAQHQHPAHVFGVSPFQLNHRQLSGREGSPVADLALGAHHRHLGSMSGQGRSPGAAAGAAGERKTGGGAGNSYVARMAVGIDDVHDGPIERWPTKEAPSASALGGSGRGGGGCGGTPTPLAGAACCFVRPKVPTADFFPQHAKGRAERYMKTSMPAQAQASAGSSGVKLRGGGRTGGDGGSASLPAGNSSGGGLDATPPAGAGGGGAMAKRRSRAGGGGFGLAHSSGNTARKLFPSKSGGLVPTAAGTTAAAPMRQHPYTPLSAVPPSRTYPSAGARPRRGGGGGAHGSRHAHGSAHTTNAGVHAYQQQQQRQQPRAGPEPTAFSNVVFEL